MKDCVFCKIAKGEMKVERLAENDEYLAFLSANPVYDGMTVVIPKKHAGSYVYESLSDEELARLHKFARKVALLLDKALGSERCVQVMEGLDIDHAHLKLFPKYKGVTSAIMEREIFDLKGLPEVAAKIRKEAEGK